MHLKLCHVLAKTDNVPGTMDVDGHCELKLLVEPHGGCHMEDYGDLANEGRPLGW